MRAIKIIATVLALMFWLGPVDQVVMAAQDTDAVTKKKSKKRNGKAKAKRAGANGPKKLDETPYGEEVPPAGEEGLSNQENDGGDAPETLTDNLDPQAAEGSLRRSNRMEFDERLVKGQAAKSGAVYLFKRTPRRLPGLVPMRKSYRKRIVAPVLGQRELKPAVFGDASSAKPEQEDKKKWPASEVPGEQLVPDDASQMVSKEVSGEHPVTDDASEVASKNGHSKAGNKKPAKKRKRKRRGGTK
ncbi:MAG: hypothetical protein QNJ97_13720 [Myxococcota bacterium]|nr:hypothetical protein [Myxococcota bacterium]